MSDVVTVSESVSVIIAPLELYLVFEDYIPGILFGAYAPEILAEGFVPSITYE